MDDQPFRSIVRRPSSAVSHNPMSITEAPSSNGAPAKPAAFPRTVIVTGGSKGIGKGIATVFARQGANVLIVARHLDPATACVAETKAVPPGSVSVSVVFVAGSGPAFETVTV